MSTWRIPSVAYNGKDSDPIESDTFEGLVAGVERRAMEFGVTARRTSVWEEFDEEALELLSIATKPAALAGGIPKLAAIHDEINAELSRRQA